MIQVSQSEIAAFRRCPRKWFVNWFLGFQPAHQLPYGNSPLGVRVHAALEGWYGYDLDPVTVITILYRIEMERAPEYEQELRAEYELAVAMVAGYLEWVSESGADSDLTVVATEAEVIVPLPGVEGVELRARMDQVAMQVSNGTLGFMDYKTGANFERAQLLRLDPQMKFYSLVQQLAASRAGPDHPVILGGWITQLRRVKRTERAQPPFYQRDPFRYNPDEIRSTYLKVRNTCAEIARIRARLTTAYGKGGTLDVINELQRSELSPVPIIRDCSWSCPLSNDLCGSMDDGSDWPGMLASGAWVQDDPYAYYRQDPLRAVREELSKL